MTNALGRKLAAAWAEENGKYGGVTLGAYRRGKNMPWIPGATIDVWSKCARTENVTGVPWPHCMFVQTIGGPDGCSIFCPSCREELRKNPPQRVASPSPKKPSNQLSLF